MVVFLIALAIVLALVSFFYWYLWKKTKAILEERTEAITRKCKELEVYENLVFYQPLFREVTYTDNMGRQSKLYEPIFTPKQPSNTIKLEDVL